MIISKPIYLVSGDVKCWKCGAPLRVAGIVGETALAEGAQETVLLSEVETLPSGVLDFIQRRFPSYQPTFSKTAELNYFANVCPACGVLSGDFHLREPGAVFFPMGPDDAQRLTRETIPIDSMDIEAQYAGGSPIYLIAECAREL